jgi:hypothetical protein
MRLVSNIVDEELSGAEIKRLIVSLEERGFETTFVSKGDMREDFEIRIKRKLEKKLGVKH